MNRLAEIIESKHEEVQALLPKLHKLKYAATERNAFRSFRTAIDRGPDALGLIAEIKKASPSAGTIAEDFDPSQIAQNYQHAGAHAISVLTDHKYFQGNLSYLSLVRSVCSLPLLRKDFIVHEAQVYEAVVAGADAVLLIVAALDQPTLEHLLETARAYQLDVLVEVHDRPELERALDARADIIGVNNRNLKTFEVDLATTRDLSEDVPEDVLLVSESGIRGPDDARNVLDWGANAILVGEALMRSDDVVGHARALLTVELSGEATL